MKRLAVSIESTETDHEPDATEPGREISQPFRLRLGLLARYTLPRGFSLNDLRKLVMHLATMCHDWEPEDGWPAVVFPTAEVANRDAETVMLGKLDRMLRLLEADPAALRAELTEWRAYLAGGGSL